MTRLFLKVKITSGELQGTAVIFAMSNVCMIYKYQPNIYRLITAIDALIRAELINYELTQFEHL